VKWRPGVSGGISAKGARQPSVEPFQRDEKILLLRQQGREEEGKTKN